MVGVPSSTSERQITHIFFDSALGLGFLTTSSTDHGFQNPLLTGSLTRTLLGMPEDVFQQ